jgi:hypothetical protein
MACYGHSFSILYVADVCTSLEAHASTTCYGHRFTYLRPWSRTTAVPLHSDLSGDVIHSTVCLTVGSNSRPTFRKGRLEAIHWMCIDVMVDRRSCCYSPVSSCRLIVVQRFPFLCINGNLSQFIIPDTVNHPQQIPCSTLREMWSLSLRFSDQNFVYIYLHSCYMPWLEGNSYNCYFNLG